MKASLRNVRNLVIVGAIIAACGDSQVVIGTDDSGGIDGGNQGDVNQGSDVTTEASANDGDGSVLVDGGLCTPDGGVGFQCGTITCKDNQTEYCKNISPYFGCLPMPAECCGINLTCTCLLTYAPNPCGGGAVPKCTSNSSGSLYLGCN